MKDLFSTTYAAFDLSVGIELTVISIDHVLKKLNENIFPAALRSIDIEDIAAVNIAKWRHG